MKKNLFKIFILSVTLLSLSGCGGVDRNSSIEVAKAYMEAYVDKDIDSVKELANNQKKRISDDNIYDHNYLRTENENTDRPMYVFKIKTDFQGKKIYRRMLVRTKENPENDEWYVEMAGIAPLEYK